SGDSLRRNRVFGYQVRRLIVSAVLSNCHDGSALLDRRAFQLLLAVVRMLWHHFRRHCKVELVVLLEHFLLRVLRSSSRKVPAAWRMQVMDELLRWFDVPHNLVELFFNYDMDRKFIQQWKIFQEMCSLMCSLAEGCAGAAAGAAAGPEQDRVALRLQALKSAAQIVKSLMDASGHGYLIARDARTREISLGAAGGWEEDDSDTDTDGGDSDLLGDGGGAGAGMKSDTEAARVAVKARRLLAASGRGLSSAAAVAAAAAAEAEEEESGSEVPPAPALTPTAAGDEAAGGASAAITPPATAFGNGNGRAAAATNGAAGGASAIATAIAANGSGGRRGGLPGRRRRRPNSFRHRRELRKRAEEVMKQALELYHAKGLKKAVQYLVASSFLADTPHDIANFLRVYRQELDAAAIGEFLSEPDFDSGEYWKLIRLQYVRAISFHGMTLEEALRHLLTNSGFRLPGEAQKIDRLLSAFAECYYADNRGQASFPFASAETPYVLSYAIIMLNTDLHRANAGSKKKRKRMTKDAFISNLRGVAGVAGASGRGAAARAQHVQPPLLRGGAGHEPVARPRAAHVRGRVVPLPRRRQLGAGPAARGRGGGADVPRHRAVR
ncbi:unnamed protein product, partial [Phaeothamnion confervicola]